MRVPTVLVRRIDGCVVVINKDDFDPAEHMYVGSCAETGKPEEPEESTLNSILELKVAEAKELIESTDSIAILNEYFRQENEGYPPRKRVLSAIEARKIELEGVDESDSDDVD